MKNILKNTLGLRGVYYVLLVCLLLLALPGCSIINKTSRARQEAEQRIEDRRQEGERIIEDAKKRHKRMQARETRQRMQETRRKSDRFNQRFR